MIKVENTDVWGFEHAVRGMRNPFDSWDKSDSKYRKGTDGMSIDAQMANNYQIGTNDLDLMRKLFKASLKGNYAHRKFLRQIFVSMDIIAPLYWWKEFDTYKVGTVANSCSTMHKIHSKEFTINDFSYEHLSDSGKNCLSYIISELNSAREIYLYSKNKEHWWDMIQLLPTSYNQKRTVTMNYENVVNIILQRTGHKLDEWCDFVDVLCKLPYLDEITKKEANNGDKT